MKVRCPACKQWASWSDNPCRPFCSESCKSADLGNWATERYRIPDADKDADEDGTRPSGVEDDETSETRRRR